MARCNLTQGMNRDQELNAKNKAMMKPNVLLSSPNN